MLIKAHSIPRKKIGILTRCIILTAILIAAHSATAQRVALKTNTIDWITLSPNLSVEARLNSPLSLQIGFAANPFNFAIADLCLKNFRVEPELRYWFNRPMARHFMALSLTAGAYSLRHADHHFTGDAVGAGLSYGYAVVLSNHWNMEVEAGVGIAHLSAYNYYGDVAPESKNYSRFIPVPIRLGLSFSYIFK